MHRCTRARSLATVTEAGRCCIVASLASANSTRLEASFVGGMVLQRVQIG